MASRKYELKDFMELAYEFAIRNPRVIELLTSPLNDNAVEELLTFGIDATSVYLNEGQEVTINSIQELYFDYEHLSKIDHRPYSPFVGESSDFCGYKILLHPKYHDTFYKKEDTLQAYERIIQLIESRGNKLQRLMNGIAFKHYDAFTFMRKTVYQLDPSGNNKKTIKSDIDFISEWIQPSKYLQLIPQCKSILLSF